MTFTIDDEKIQDFLGHILGTDPRSSDNYNRCIRKKWRGKGEKNFYLEYKQFRELCRKYQKPEVEVFCCQVFDYWKTMAEDSGIYRYQAFLLSFFAEGCEHLWSPRIGGKIRKVLEDIDSRDIWELIAGEKNEKVVNEITFYNERLKNTTISFVLKDRNEEAIEKVYNVFRNFVCAGEKMEDGRLRFTVSYEMFFYRKIHMALMALSNLIEEVAPKETEEIINKRIENKKEV